MSDWVRVTRSHPCPVCGKPDWCLVSRDGAAVICPRVPSPRRCGEAGWLHRHADFDTPAVPTNKPADRGPGLDLTDFAGRCARGLEPGRLESFARSLGVSAGSLAALGCGWSGDHLAWTFPMTDPAAGRVCGVRLRLPDGRKLSVKGGREGLFLPAGAAGPVLAVAEGPTDAAALLDLGLAAVGRPSCSGGVRHLLALVAARRPARVVVFADADGPGQDGARRLLAELPVPAAVVTPPAKDVREWVRAGATADDVRRLVGG